MRKGMKFDCIFEETLDFIDVDYTHLNKTIRYEQRQHGEWIWKFDENTGTSGKHCSVCGFPDVQIYKSFCGQCGADMRAKEGESE